MVAMAIDVGQTRRCAGAYPTFDGRFHYLLELSGGEIDDFDGAGYEGDVLKCSLAYIAVAGFEARDAGRRRSAAWRSVVRAGAGLALCAAGAHLKRRSRRAAR